MDFREQRFLVTGNDGFVGKHLVNELKAKGAEVIGIDIQSGIDIRNWNRLKNIEDVDIVYHLAAIMYVPFSWKNPHVLFEVNVLGTLNILEYCRLHSVKKIVFASSYLYGNPKYLPIDEKHPIDLLNPYARSKKIAEDLCIGYSEDFGLNSLILRFFNIYGPGQNKNFLIPMVMEQLKKGKIVLDDPEPRRDFLYVKDAVEAYLKAGTSDNSNFEIFNIGSGVNHSVDEIVRKFITISGQNITVNYRNKRRKNEIMETVADISKAKKLLGWEPKIDLEKGIDKLLFQ